MAWCPKCKSEYVGGITRCADCNCDLVDSLQEGKKISTWDEDVAYKVKELQKQEALMQAKEEELEDTLLEMDAEVLEEAFEEMMQKEQAEFEEAVKTPRHVLPYVNNAEKAEEHKSSAYSLLVIGAAGLVFVILFFFDVLPIRMALVNKYIISGVMGALFVLFLVMGVISLKNAKVLATKAKKENDLTKEIKRWCSDYMSAESVDSKLSITDASEEIKYFHRFDKMKEMIQNQFMYLDEAYLDRLIDEIYPDIFEDEQA